ncbi:App1 family protein [Neptunitalea lumnitzerae]|uniref:Phosphatase n=1 Tax=Neptunitalea lumnitzerae TaxID=2965509 RepID=A0ABQ5MJX5_9FLAO|nr:App1 family protein [Neptunitalea sp. Y10]GLB49689.1 phosphatase [Neptunitalea sp. Y10]
MKIDLKIYRGYANKHSIVISGHVFKKLSPDSFQLDQKWYRHALTVIQMFRIKTLKNVDIHFNFNGLKAHTKTKEDGQFILKIPYNITLDSGWHQFQITAKTENSEIIKKGEFVRPYPGEYGIISDIDDTFLISHSGNFFKKIYVLLTKNVHKRKVFNDVVDHYRLLNYLGRENNDTNNAFFYVSSSEWNLYNFITQFTKIHKFPKAVLALKDIKTGIADFLFTGGGSHNHKFHKIKELVTFYPELRFVLLGDDSQKDPFIYENICKMFPKNISTVYIRQTGSQQKQKVLTALNTMKSLNVKYCYFTNSTDAINHTKKYLG